MSLDFGAMTRAELRAYVLAHPGDSVAFQTFVDRLTAEVSSEIFDLPRFPVEIEAVENLIRQKLAQQPEISTD